MQVCIRRITSPIQNLSVNDLPENPGDTDKTGIMLSVDMIPFEPVTGTKSILGIVVLLNLEKEIILKGDFTSEDVKLKIMQTLNGGKVSLILSDMLPNMTGQADADHDKAMNLCDEVIDFLPRCMKSGGDLLIKVTQGARLQEFQTRLKTKFASVISIKPSASRKESREIYMLAKGYSEKL